MKRNIKRKKFKPKFSLGKYFTFFLTVIFFSSSIFAYILAEKIDFSVTDLLQTLWFSIVTMTTTGYGDIVPKTYWGKAIAVLFMLVGIVSASLFTAAVSSFLVNENIFNKRDQRRLKKMKNHTMILGYKEDLGLLIKDILIYENNLKSYDIVLINNLDKTKIKQDLLANDIDGLNYVDGDQSDEITLIKAGVRRAKKAIVISNPLSSTDAESIDAKTAVVVMMLHSLNPNLYICAEVLTFKYKSHLKNFKCDEVIHGSQYTRFLLASAASYAGITNVVDKLFDRGDDALLTLEVVTKDIIGHSFSEVCLKYREKTGKIVIGVVENMGAEMLLKKQAIAEAQKTPDLGELVKNLKEARELEKNKAIINPVGNYIIKKHSAIIAINTGAIFE